MRFADKLSENTRQILVAMIPISFLGILTYQFAVENKPDSVENMGALITIWALINISINRTRFENSVASWENSNIWQYLNYQEAQNKFRDSALHLTFDIHACQIAKISTRLEIENPFCESSAEAINAFADNINKRYMEGDNFAAMQEANEKKVADFNKRYQESISESKSWESFLWRLEFILAIWGTMQGAFGAEALAFMQSAH